MKNRLKTLLITIELIIAITSAAYIMNPLKVQAQVTPKITIEPSFYQAQKLGEAFTLDVNIYNLETTDNTTSVQFRVTYNATLLEALSATEGPFMQQFNNTAEPPYTYFLSYIEDDPRYGPHVLVGILLVPNGTGHWTNFPEGNGTLATITFKTIYRPVEPATATCSFNLNDTMILYNLNETGVDIDHTTTGATYEALPAPPSISYEPSIPTAGEPVFFKGPEANYSAHWNFGDGTSKNVTEPSVEHIYAIPGEYNVTLTCITGNLTSTVSKIITIWPYKPTIDVTIDVGSIHFGGEIAEFNVLTTNCGEAINATKIEALLYHSGVLHADLTSSVQPVDTGFYRIPYNISVEAETGTYTLIVKAEYYNAKGTSMKSFQISKTLTSWDDSIPKITEIKNDTATILDGLNYIKLNLTAINATLAGVEGTVGYINSTLGPMIIEDIHDINATLSELILDNGELFVEIDTTLGSIYTDLRDINATITGILVDNGELFVEIDTTLGSIYTDLRDINATITGILVDNGELLGEIDTALGTVTMNLDSLDGEITEVKGDTATISTTLGEVELKLGDIQGTAKTTLYAASILSAIAAILAAVILLILRKK